MKLPTYKVLKNNYSKWLGVALLAVSSLAMSPSWAQIASTAEAVTTTTTTPAENAKAPVAEASNPYGLDALWKGSDAVTKSTLLILLAMSGGSWFVLFTKYAEQFKLERQARKADTTFWTSGGVRQGIESLEEVSPFRFVATAAEDAIGNHRGLLGYIDFNTWITQAIQRSIDTIQSRLQEGLAFLATVGSTAPFVGLFGTVWGIYHALTAIGIAGQASIDKVAGPVGESLIMTAIGLAVAVPAVLGYNWLVRRNKSALEKVRAFGVDLHGVILGEAAALASARGDAANSNVKPFELKLAASAFAR